MIAGSLVIDGIEQLYIQQHGRTLNVIRMEDDNHKMSFLHDELLVMFKKYQYRDMKVGKRLLGDEKHKGVRYTS